MDQHEALLRLELAKNNYLEELVKIEGQIHDREDRLNAYEARLKDREAAIRAREAELQTQEDLRKAKKASEEDNENLKLQRRLENLNKIVKELDLKKEIVKRGLQNMNADIKRHHALLKSAIEELKIKAKVNRADFFEMLARELQAFKLPSSDKILDCERKNGMIRDIKK